MTQRTSHVLISLQVISPDLHTPEGPADSPPQSSFPTPRCSKAPQGRLPDHISAKPSFPADMSYLASCGWVCCWPWTQGSGAVLWDAGLGVSCGGRLHMAPGKPAPLPHLTLARDTLHFLALRWGHIRLPASGPQDQPPTSLP